MDQQAITWIGLAWSGQQLTLKAWIDKEEQSSDDCQRRKQDRGEHNPNPVHTHLVMNTKNLGHVNARFILNHNKLRLNLRVSSNDAKSRMSNRLPALISALRKLGAAIDNIDLERDDNI